MLLCMCVMLLLVLLLSELYDFVCIAHCLQHAEACTGPDVSGKTDLHTSSKSALQRKQSAAQKRVGRGAERNRGSRLGKRLQMLLADMHAMCKDRFTRDKAVVLVHAEIIPSIEKMFDKIDLLRVLAEVGVNVDSGVFPGKLTRKFKLTVSGCRSESRRYRVSVINNEIKYDEKSDRIYLALPLPCHFSMSILQSS